MALNPEIGNLVVEIKAFATAQGFSESKAFRVALVRICKQWATGQTVPQSENAVLIDAVDKLSGRLLNISAVFGAARTTVAGNHQSEVDAIVAGVVVPE